MTYNDNALQFQSQIVISDTTNASISSASLMVAGGLSSKDTYVTGHVAVNNVKITPNLNDIIFEQQAILEQSRSEWTNIPDFSFNNSVSNSFKAFVNVTVAAGISKYAIWELNGIYKPSGWSITSSFSGDITNINFRCLNSDGIGQIQYTNSNSVGSTTTIRYRASTTAPIGTTPTGSVGIINNTNGPYIANTLLYSNTVDTLASTDLVYDSNIFKIGGGSRIVAENANSFTSFSNGGSITAMGDASVAKELIVGQKIGIANTNPSFTLDVSGDINFTGNFYKNNSLYSGSSIWQTNNKDVFYTEGNLGLGTSSPAYTLDVSGGARITTGITAGSSTFTGVSAGDSQFTNLSTGNINFTGNLFQNGSAYIGSQWMGTSGSIYYGTAGSSTVGINTTAPGATLDVSGTARITTSLTTGAVFSTNLTSTNIVATSLSSGTLTVTNISSDSLYSTISSFGTVSSSMLSASTMTGGNISLSGDLNVAGTLTVVNITSTNMIETNITTATLLATTSVSSGILNATNTTVTNAVHTTLSSGTLVGTTLSTGNVHGSLGTITNMVHTALSTGTLTVTHITTDTLLATTSLSSGSIHSTNIVATNSSLGTINAIGATMGGNFVPSENITYDLGSSSLRWKDLYLSGNTIHLGEKQLSLAGDAFTVEKINITSTEETVSSTSGALVIDGGMGISKSLTVNGTVSSSLVSSASIHGTNSTITNAVHTTLSSGNAIFTDLTAGTLSSSHINVTTSTIATLRNTNAVSTNVSAATLNLSTGLTSTSAQITNENVTTSTIATLRNTNADVTTSTIATLRNTNAVSTNVSAATLNLSTGLSSASAQITNADVTTSTIATLRNTNAVSTNVSAATLNLSTGLTSASAQITNVAATNISSTSLYSTIGSFGTVSSSLLSASTITGGSISLSGNLNVAGTLTVVNITSTNLMDTNLTAGTIRVTGNADLTGGVVSATNVSTTTLTSANAVFTTGATIPTLLNTNAVSTNVSAATLNLSTGLSSASAQITNADVTTSTIATLRNTNAVSTNVSAATLNLSTGITTGTIRVTGNADLTDGVVSATNVSTTTLTSANVVFTNCSTGTINLRSQIDNPITAIINISTGSFIHSATFVNPSLPSGAVINMGWGQEDSARNIGYIGFQYVTSGNTSNFLTLGLHSVDRVLNINGLGYVGIGTTAPAYALDVVGTIDATNLIASTSITTGTIRVTGNADLTGGVVSATNVSTTTLTSANAVMTNISSTSLYSTIGSFGTVSSSLLSASTITGGSISLSGNLNVAGTLTVVNITSTNLMDTNLTAGIARITTNLAATGNSNTIGNIFTTGGNVGINTTSPIYTLDVRGTCDVSTSITTAALFSTNITSTNIVGTNMTAGNLRFNNNGSGLIWGTNSSRIYDDGHLRIFTDDNLFFHTTNTTGCAMFIASTNGNVGIGTTSPGESLDVRGNLRLGNNTQGNYISFSGTSGDEPGNYNHTYIGERIYGGLESSELLLFKGNDRSSTAGPDRIRLLAAEHRLDIYTTVLSGSFETVGSTSSTTVLTVATSGNIGINTTAPTTAKLVISGSNGATGLDLSSTDQYAEMRVIRNSLSSIDKDMWLQHGAGSGSKLRLYSNNTETMVLNNGNVGVGTSAPGYKLHVSGDIYSSGDITAFSDIRLKENIVQLSGCLDKIDNIRGVSFNRIDTGSKHIGLIAQEVEAEFPQLVATDINSGFKSVNYGNVVAVLLECIRELKVEVNKLNSRI